MRVRVLLVLGLVAIVGGGGLIYGLHGETAAPATTGRAPKAVPVQVAATDERAMPVNFATVGRVQTLASVAVRSRIDGVIDKVSVADGQEVKAGDLLFHLDDREATAAVKQAQAALSRDQASGAMAQRQVDRLTPLAQKNYTTRQDYDTAQTSVATLRATVAADQAALDSAKVDLSYTTITAPISGRIGTVALKTGSSVRSADSTALVTINQIRPILVAFSVPQQSLAELQQAMAAGPVKVTAHIPDSHAPSHDGLVSFTENAVDPLTNTLPVRAQFPNEDEALWPGLFVDVTITFRTVPNAIVIPSAALQIGQNGSYVWVVKPDETVETRPVTVGWQDSRDAVITQGLAKGETVVTDGALRLETGIKVKILPTAANSLAEDTPPKSAGLSEASDGQNSQAKPQGSSGANQ
ncbi:MAG TPA: efflux RND transporter periplasmic adaptor subunit [Dongiaceae bacterium]